MICNSFMPEEHNLLILWSFCSFGQLVCDCVERCTRHRSTYVLTIEGILIPVRSGCNCIILSDLNLTLHFQQWQYSNCFEKSWLSFWMISKYQHPPSLPPSLPPPPPASLYSASCLSTMKCYYRRLSFTEPWGLFGIAPPLSDPPQLFSARLQTNTVFGLV